MKKLLLAFIGLFMTLTLWAQVPQNFNYQAVLRDNEGGVLVNEAVDINISILQGSAGGAAIYSEAHNTQTNAFGLINLQIGQGTSSHEFSSINWAEGPFFILVSVNGTLFGTTQLLSVPYALYAEQAGNTFSGSFNDLTDVPEFPDPSNAFSGNFNDLTNIPENLDTDSTDDFSGSFKDLTNIPLVFDTANSFTGSFDDLTNIPENLDTDSTDDFSGSFSDLSDIPENLDLDSTDDFSGDYNDLINKPEIPEAVEQAFSENDSVAFISDKKVGIGTETARGRMEVLDGGVVFAGDSGTVEIAGAGTRLMWIPEKAAFRGGQVNGEQWDIDSIGTASVAIGSNTQASGDYSTAIGHFTQASGNASTSMGGVSHASGDYATTMGFNAYASGDHATAMGRAARASGRASTAMGYFTQAGGDYATAMGYGTDAIGDYATAMGRNTQASGNNSTAMGSSTEASGNNSTAMGSGTEASGPTSTAMGYRTAARGIFSTAIGDLAKANHNGSIVIAANSIASVADSIASSAAEQMVLRADGNFFFCNRKVTVPNETNKLINTSTGAFLSTGGTWTNASDRHLKENFTPIDAESLIEKIKVLEVTIWNYKKEGKGITHIGPMAQDFYRIYGLGQDDKSISTVDGIGVALATIKALVERNEKLESRLEALENRVEQFLSSSQEDGGSAGKE